MILIFFKSYWPMLAPGIGYVLTSIGHALLKMPPNASRGRRAVARVVPTTSRGKKWNKMKVPILTKEPFDEDPPTVPPSEQDTK